MPKPLLKQFGNLTPDDLMAHPIWIGCHGVDYEEEWYDETTEETFRVWEGAKPVNADETFLVAAQFTFADGSKHPGFVTPTESDEGFKVLYLSYLDPMVFSPSGKRFLLWFGMSNEVEAIANFYAAFGKTAAEIFPIEFQARPDLTTGLARGFVPK
jgi:hypothetical protein